MQYHYRALQIRQTANQKLLVLFAAPAVEMRIWAGVPQKQRLENGDETVGFQRDENEGRIESLKKFYQDDDNIVQNALLGATRNSQLGAVTFEPDAEQSGRQVIDGTLKVTVPDDMAFMPLVELFQMLRQHLEARVPDLANERVQNTERFRELQREVASTPGSTTSGDADESDEEEGAPEPEDDDNGDAPIALSDESHILDFWRDVASRHELLKTIGSEAPTSEFLGFTREVLLSYLLPVVLVDGQHRLVGAMRAAEAKLDEANIQAEIRTRINEGGSASEVKADLLLRECRVLPMSLLMTSEPEEQVFQFIVVNQKATPIGRALLGTIVSTTLSNEEIEKVAGRLRDAGIPLEESRAITYLARNAESPFYERVERGLAGGGADLLQWTALSSLIRIFRELQGGRLYGQKNDYADVWRRSHLDQSAIIADYANVGFDSGFEYWKQLDGPWRAVFMRFFEAVRDQLGSTDDPDRFNYWGKPRRSNLFNKVSLTILAADFFQYLSEKELTIDSSDDIPRLVQDWLKKVNRGYFDKDWDLSGVKKDSTGIRNQWAHQWYEYRKAGGSLPDKRLFRKPKAG